MQNTGIGIRHRGERRFVFCARRRSDTIERVAPGQERGDARGHRVCVRIDKKAVNAIANALGERADTRRDHGNAEAAQFRQCVAEGFRHGRQQQRSIRCDARDERGKLVTLVVEHDMHAAFAEQRVRIGAGADEIKIGMFAEFRERGLEQFRALAATHAPRHEEARALARRRMRARRRTFGPRRESVRDHALGQFRKFGRQPQLVGQRGTARRDQSRAGRTQRRHGRIAQHTPMFRIAIGKFRVVAERGEIARALQVVEAQRLVAEIAMQRRPEWIVIVDHAKRRQARRQHVETVTDQRRDDQRIDAMVANDAGEDVAIRTVGQSGIRDRHRQRDAQARRSLHRAVVQLDPFAVSPTREAPARDENEMTGLVECPREIAHPAFGAAAPAVQHVQKHRSRVESRSIRRRAGAKRGRHAFAERGERRGWRRIARIVACRCRFGSRHVGVHVEMIEQHATQTVLGQRVGIGGRRVTELREAFAVPRTRGRAA